MTDRQILEQTGPLLTEWFRNNKRDLPWRQPGNPYGTWVSEIMLQQTRIEAVKEYYARFMKKLPTIEALAEAEEETVLKLWEGLGYYSRARNLQKAARVCREEYGGQLPGDAALLRKLPGIGDYTAGAIASMAFGIAEPAVDGNVMRVAARLLADDRDIMKQSFRREITELLREVMPADAAGDYNEGIMELGETICIPGGAPLCDGCPLKTICRSFQAGTQELYPVRIVKKSKKIEEKTILLWQTDGKTALRRRPAQGLLAGMYEYPWLEGCMTPEQVKEYLRQKQISYQSIEELGPSEHIFSHVRWKMTGYRILGAPVNEAYIYADPADMQTKYPLPTAFKKYEAE